MKIIQTDNFDREGLGADDKLLFYINSPETAAEIVRLMNADCQDPYCDVYFKAVHDNFKLKKFEP